MSYFVFLILGLSIAFNITLLFAVFCFSEAVKDLHREKLALKEKVEQCNMYKGIESIMRDDEWDRIGNIPEPNYDISCDGNKQQFVTAVGSREKIPNR